MFCAFFRKPRREDLPHTIDYYQRSSSRAINSLDADYETLSDQRGRTFSVTHTPTGHVVNAHADTAIDYYASIVSAVERIKTVVEMDAFKP